MVSRVTQTSSWEKCERKVRRFIEKDLNLSSSSDVEIERAHRVKSNDSQKCRIVVKFLKYTDCVKVRKRVYQVFTPNSNTQYKMQPDSTDRVKRHRRELGNIMVSELKKGNYSVVRYDKLVVEDKVFRYDESTEDKVCIGRRKDHPSRANLHMRNRNAAG